MGIFVSNTYALSPKLWPPLPHLYSHESDFVCIPARTGQVIAVPAVAIEAGIAYGIILSAPQAPSSNYAHNIFEDVANGTFFFFSFTCGAPFYLIEKLFWDTPVYLYQEIFDDKCDSSNISQPSG